MFFLSKYGYTFTQNKESINMRKIVSLLILFISISIFAQNPKIGVITGKVIDASTQEELPYVSIVIKDAKNKILTGGITNDKGQFEIKQIQIGENTIEIQFIGYKTEVKKVVFSRQSSKHNLGAISLSVDAAQLDEVVVIAETSTVVQKIDRKVINVGKDLTSAGASASELLNNVQSVSVDSQTGNISLRGNENVRILIDGKPTSISAAQLLKQIPSTSIKQVELITNPSAKYNPEGMSGMINIILHKNSKQGFNGSINLGVTQGKNTRFNGSIDMNYKVGKVNFFTNYGYNTGKRKMWGETNILNSNPLIQTFLFNRDRTNHLLKFGADIYIDKKNTLSIYTTQNFSNNQTLGLSEVFQNSVLITNAPWIRNSKSNSGAYNLNYKMEFEKEEHSLEFEVNYSKSDSPEFANYQELIDPLSLLANYTNDIVNDRNNTLINLDYTNPISKNGTLELGIEYRVNNTANFNNTSQYSNIRDFDGTIIGTEPIGSTAFNYDRDIYSAYISYGHKFDKITMQLGTRFEQYEVDGNFANGNENATYKEDIFSIYPSAFFTFNPSDKNQFQLSYSRRVDRPSSRQVNPIPRWSTPLVTAVGNPNLKPQFTNSFEVNYTRNLENGSITFGTFYRRVNDDISRNSTLDPLDQDGIRQIRSFTNYDSTNRYGIEFSTNYKITKWWRINGSMDFYSQKERDLERVVTANSFNARINNSFTASKNLKFQLFGMYRGAKDGIQNNRDAMWMINSGVSLDVLKRKGTINFRVNDIFKGMKYSFNATEPTVQKGLFTWESRTAYLGFSYRFGGGKNKALRRKNRGNDEPRDNGGFM